jgi:ribosomal protein S18 acetylase RimI-like enzyme
VSIEVKILGNGDQAVLDTVAPEVFDDPIDEAAAREFLRDPRHRIAVALDEGAVVGFVSAVVYVHPDKPRPELWINEVGVAPTHHGRGIGRRLLEAMLEAARAANCREAWVLTDRSNEAAMRLYASAGGQDTPGDHVMFTFFIDPDSSR